MVSVAHSGPGDPGFKSRLVRCHEFKSKIEFHENTIVWYSSKYCNPAMGDTFLGGDK